MGALATVIVLMAAAFARRAGAELTAPHSSALRTVVPVTDSVRETFVCVILALLALIVPF